MNDSQNEPGPATVNGGTSGALRQAAQSQTARRNMLRRGGIVAAATVAGLTMLDQRRAEATSGQPFTLGQANDADATTELHSTVNGATLVPLFHVNGTASGKTLSGTSTTMIVDGPGSIQGIALRVNGNSGGTGLIASAATGPSGTVGLALSASGSNGAHGINASSDKGIAVAASSTSGQGVSGHSTSNTGVAGSSVAGVGVAGSSSSKAGVAGTSVKAAGVTGKGTRGGIFAGPLANVQLTPHTGAHPKSGAAGDLFVDKAHHLWFCHGGTSWTKLA
jgi:hypothetical protein